MVVEGSQVLAQATVAVAKRFPGNSVRSAHGVFVRPIAVSPAVDLVLDEVGPPELHAWLHYEPIPARDDLAKALLAHFTGHLAISTTMRAHPGIGTSQAHYTVSTAPMTITVSFHEPVSYSGWLLYTHECTHVGAGMSYVRGQIHTQEGERIASFTQEGMIRPMRQGDSQIEARARL